MKMKKIARILLFNECVDKRMLLLIAEKKDISWEHIDLPAFLKDQCIAYSDREGSTFKIGKPSKEAVIFVFEDGSVYDIVLLLLGKRSCWRTLPSKSLEWIKEQL